MEHDQKIGNRPRILVLGATGRTGKAVVQELKSRQEEFEVVLASRNHKQVEGWKQLGPQPCISIWKMQEPFSQLLRE